MATKGKQETDVRELLRAIEEMEERHTAQNHRLAAWLEEGFRKTLEGNKKLQDGLQGLVKRTSASKMKIGNSETNNEPSWQETRN